MSIFMNSILFAISTFFKNDNWLTAIFKSKWFYILIGIIGLVYLSNFAVKKVDRHYHDKYQLQIDQSSQEYKNNLTLLNNEVIGLKDELSVERNRLSFLLDKEVAEYVQVMDSEAYKDRDLYDSILDKYGIPDAWLFIKTECRSGDTDSVGTDTDTRPSCDDTAYITGKIIEARYATLLAKLVRDLANEAKRADEIRGKYNALVKINNSQRKTLEAYNKRIMEMREIVKDTVQKYNQISMLSLYSK